MGRCKKVKNHQIFQIFFSLNHTYLGAHFLLLIYFDIINSSITSLFSKMMPLHQFTEFNNFLSVCWFLAKIFSHFVSLPWKLNNPYYHNHHQHQQQQQQHQQQQQQQQQQGVQPQLNLEDKMISNSPSRPSILRRREGDPRDLSGMPDTPPPR